MNSTSGTSAPAKAGISAPAKARELTGPALARAYENALHVLDRDAAILDQLRSRANILLAALAIGVTALGWILTNTTRMPVPIWLEALLVGLLVLSILCCVGVLWPVRDHGEFTVTELQPVRAARAEQRATAAAAEAWVEAADRIKAAAATRDDAIAAARDMFAAQVQIPAEAQMARRWEATAHFTRGEPVAERAGCLRIWPRYRPGPAMLTVSLTGPTADRAAEAERARADRIAAAAAIRDAAIAAARTGEAHAKTLAREEIKQARADAEAPSDIDGTQRTTSAAGQNPEIAVIEARAANIKNAILQARTQAQDLIDHAIRVRDDAVSMVADLKQVRAGARARGKAVIAGPAAAVAVVEARAARAEEVLRQAKARAARAEEALSRARAEARSVIDGALSQARAEARYLVDVAARARDDAVVAIAEAVIAGSAAAVAVIEARAASAEEALSRARAATAGLEQVSRWQRFTQWMAKLRALAGRAWRHLKEPWGKWRQTVGHNQRLWKTVLGEKDLARVPLGGTQDEVDQVLLEVMYRAHDLNNGTLSRRADLLRFATLLVVAFVITLSAWLPSHV